MQTYKELIFEIVLECFIHHIMRLMAAIFAKKAKLLMINSYLGNICPFETTSSLRADYITLTLYSLRAG